jgi:hypothetical protein
VRCFAVSSQSEERSFGDGLLSATVGYCRPQGLPDESVPASAFTNQRGVGKGWGPGHPSVCWALGGSGCHRPWVFSLMAVPGTRGRPLLLLYGTRAVFSRSMPEFASPLCATGGVTVSNGLT